ncbi:MAG: zinc ribbon domain-containing protein [Burkholderiales bacterium]|nr:zinc ribbon domain-containing protein [Burkholderiales bacterium]
MALQKCHECGAQVSSEAKACPSCGAKPKKSVGLVGIIVAGIFGIIIFNAASGSGGSSSSATASARPATPPPIQRSPEVQKEIARLRAVEFNAFCSRELSKVKKLPAQWPQPWGEAMLVVMADYGVTQTHLDHIKTGSAVVGMSPCGGIASWGRPESINRTTTSSTVREQWVYNLRSYLYFTNDKLTSIQN